MMIQKRGDVDVADPVPVGQAEGLVAQVLVHALQSTPGHGSEPGVNQGHAPGFGSHVVNLNRVVGEINREIVRAVEVVEEVFLDQVALVSQADHEVVQAMRRIDLHDVPENRHRSDLDEGLGYRTRLLTDSRAITTGQDDYFHGLLPHREQPKHRGPQSRVSEIELNDFTYRFV